MKLSVLVKITPPRIVTPRAIRTLLRAIRAIRQLSGFRGWQTFRALDASDTLFIVTDWASSDELEAALGHPSVGHWLSEARAVGALADDPEILSPAFDRQLLNGICLSTLLRLSYVRNPEPAAVERDCELALQALAAPGSTRLYGARRADGHTAICRIDFDTEDGIWHFLDSRLRQQWSMLAQAQGEIELWALNLPRFECHAPDLSTQVRSVPARPRDSLCVQLRVAEDQGTAYVRLEGRIDSRASILSERFFSALINDGCECLEVDVSGLTYLSVEAAEILTRAARQLKARGGQFVLVDNETRVKRITRTKHLETSVR